MHVSYSWPSLSRPAHPFPLAASAVCRRRLFRALKKKDRKKLKIENIHFCLFCFLNSSFFFFFTLLSRQLQKGSCSLRAVHFLSSERVAGKWQQMIFRPHGDSSFPSLLSASLSEKAKKNPVYPHKHLRHLTQWGGLRKSQSDYSSRGCRATINGTPTIY